MTKLGNIIREYNSPTGSLAKTLSGLYVVWIFLVINIVSNLYSTNGRPHSSNMLGNFWVYFGLSCGAILIFAFIGILQENQYGVQPFLTRTKRRHSYLEKLDERQLETRRRIFERSYAVLAFLAIFSAFTLPTFFANGLSTNGTFIVTFNIMNFVLGLPSLVAIWDKNPFNKPLS